MTYCRDCCPASDWKNGLPVNDGRPPIDVLNEIDALVSAVRDQIVKNWPSRFNLTRRGHAHEIAVFYAHCDDADCPVWHWDAICRAAHRIRAAGYYVWSNGGGKFAVTAIDQPGVSAASEFRGCAG